MYCLKCGKATAEGQVFCKHCQEVMLRYPVKPGSVVHLTRREVQVPEKKVPQENWGTTSNDQLPKLRNLIRWLTATIALLSVLLCISAGMLLHTLYKEANAPVIGRNYITSQSDKP